MLVLLASFISSYRQARFCWSVFQSFSALSSSLEIFSSKSRNCFITKKPNVYILMTDNCNTSVSWFETWTFPHLTEVGFWNTELFELFLTFYFNISVLGKGDFQHLDTSYLTFWLPHCGSCEVICHFWMDPCFVLWNIGTANNSLTIRNPGRMESAWLQSYITLSFTYYSWSYYDTFEHE